jgi:hypothetical protein
MGDLGSRNDSTRSETDAEARVSFRWHDKISFNKQ